MNALIDAVTCSVLYLVRAVGHAGRERDREVLFIGTTWGECSIAGDGRSVVGCRLSLVVGVPFVVGV